MPETVSVAILLCVHIYQALLRFRRGIPVLPRTIAGSACRACRSWTGKPLARIVMFSHIASANLLISTCPPSSTRMFLDPRPGRSAPNRWGAAGRWKRIIQLVKEKPLAGLVGILYYCALRPSCQGYLDATAIWQLAGSRNTSLRLHCYAHS